MALLLAWLSRVLALLLARTPVPYNHKHGHVSHGWHSRCGPICLLHYYTPTAHDVMLPGAKPLGPKLALMKEASEPWVQGRLLCRAAPADRARAVMVPVALLLPWGRREMPARAPVASRLPIPPDVRRAA